MVHKTNIQYLHLSCGNIDTHSQLLLLFPLSDSSRISYPVAAAEIYTVVGILTILLGTIVFHAITCTEVTTVIFTYLQHLEKMIYV